MRSKSFVPQRMHKRNMNIFWFKNYDKGYFFYQRSLKSQGQCRKVEMFGTYVPTERFGHKGDTCTIFLVQKLLPRFSFCFKSSVKPVLYDPSREEINKVK